MLLPDAADPVQALRIARIEPDRLVEMLERRIHLVQLERGLAKLVLDRCIVRPLLGQFIHARACGEVIGALRAAMQHDDQWAPVRVLPARNVELQPGGSSCSTASCKATR